MSTQKVFVVTPSNIGYRNEYCVHGMFSNAWNLGKAGIEAVSRTYDEHPISVARNTSVRDFLTQKELKDFSHILFVDGDSVLQPTTACYLLERKKDVVSGYYLSRKGTGLPVIMKQKSKRPLCHLDNFNDYQALTLKEFYILPHKDQLVEVDAVGAGCLLVSRKAMEKISDPWFLEWHEGMKPDMHRFGEDLWFCENARKARFQIDIDRRCFTGHIAWTVLDDRYVKRALGMR